MVIMKGNSRLVSSIEDSIFLRNDYILFKKVDHLKKVEKRFVRELERESRVQGELSEDEGIYGVVDEVCFGDTLGEIKYLLNYGCDGEDGVVNIWSKEFL